VQEERFRFVDEWNSGDWNMAELCRIYGVTRKTGYKWVERFEVLGIEGLRDLSRAPHVHPNEVNDQLEEEVLALRGKHRLWGARKIRAWLAQAHAEENVPAVSTIGGILRRSGLTVPRKRCRSARPASEPLAHADHSNRVCARISKVGFGPETASGSTRLRSPTLTADSCCGAKR
jgi:transposase